jgi:hypothetical protein
MRKPLSIGSTRSIGFQRRVQLPVACVASSEARMVFLPNTKKLAARGRFFLPISLIKVYVNRYLRYISTLYIDGRSLLSLILYFRNSFTQNFISKR